MSEYRFLRINALASFIYKSVVLHLVALSTSPALISKDACGLTTDMILRKVLAIHSVRAGGSQLSLKLIIRRLLLLSLTSYKNQALLESNVTTTRTFARLMIILIKLKAWSELALVSHQLLAAGHYITPPMMVAMIESFVQTGNIDMAKKVFL